MNWKQLVGNLYHHRYGRWLLHLLMWLFIFAARYYISNISLNPYKTYNSGIVLNSFYATVSTAITYYLLVYFIYGKLFRRKKRLATVLALIALVIVYTWLDYFFEMLLMRDSTWKAITMRWNPEYYSYLQDNFFNILLKRVLTLGILYQLFLSLALPLFIKITLAYNREQLRLLELARQNVQLEFNFLKSQVNPHFLFNTLNNIYSLIIHDKTSQAADTVARLSAFMRYSLHDTATHQADAGKEMQLMTDYVELEKLRLNHTPVNARFRADRPGYQLPPLLLMPLLENAFKYCADGRSSFIDIDLSIAGGRLQFACSNSFNPAADPGQKGGIGLVNVRKRLEQYYAGQYNYEVSTANDVYSVNLSIHLL